MPAPPHEPVATAAPPGARLSTVAVHAADLDAGDEGPRPLEAGSLALGPQGERAHVAPVFLTSNYEYPSSRQADAAAQGSAFLYSRHGNPTVQTFERAAARLEGAEAGLAFASGMAALAACLTARAAGGEILASEGIYGGTTELLADLTARLGTTVRRVPAWQTETVAAALTPHTRILLVETLSNPLLRVVDLPALAALARRSGAALIVDSTFAPPCLVRPLEHGATLVVHSVSKFISGHGDVIGGLVLGSANEIAAMHKVRTLTGGIMDPFAAWLALRGLRTLPLRFERQAENAAHVARVLSALPGVRAVHYPALASHPDHARAAGSLASGGAMVSFEVADAAAARRFYDRIGVIKRAASLGDVASLCTHPASFSHKGLTPEDRKATGIVDGLLRLSIGIEDARDLEHDVRQALADPTP